MYLSPRKWLEILTCEGYKFSPKLWFSLLPQMAIIFIKHFKEFPGTYLAGTYLIHQEGTSLIKQLLSVKVITSISFPEVGKQTMKASGTFGWQERWDTARDRPAAHPRAHAAPSQVRGRRQRREPPTQASPAHALPGVTGNHSEKTLQRRVDRPSAETSHWVRRGPRGCTQSRAPGGAAGTGSRDVTPRLTPGLM